MYYIDILSNEGPLAPAVESTDGGNRLTGILEDCLTLAQSHIASLAGSPLNIHKNNKDKELTIKDQT